ncbi:hypothetical protein [Corallococcus sp. Z5C101001]|uniref:hypothetical protein n=1 Tax=Corallococcus sp. Z5C101001 TaxID=2596829 RepID=UPI00117E7186|nr:hypothetical protein [Corallococcus sp. Z5C101001]TSC25311.1 hypothetical protein FOF48_25645 [Corallococcus sp. Z5C101001]
MLCQYCETELASEEDGTCCTGCGMPPSAAAAAAKSVEQQMAAEAQGVSSKGGTGSHCDHGFRPDDCQKCNQPTRCQHKQVAQDCVSCKQAANASHLKSPAAALGGVSAAAAAGAAGNGAAAAAAAQSATPAAPKKNNEARRLQRKLDAARKAEGKNKAPPAAGAGAAAKDGAPAAAAAAASKAPTGKGTAGYSNTWTKADEELYAFVGPELKVKKQVLQAMLQKWQSALSPFHKAGLETVKAEWGSKYKIQMDTLLAKWIVDDAKAPLGDGSRANGSWAVKQIRENARRLAEDPTFNTLFPRGIGSLHHKVSQATLKALAQKLETAKEEGEPLRVFLRYIQARIRPHAEKTDYEELLLNLPANLEVGPQAELRTDDPGDAFDPNHVKPGTLSPRSKQLSEVDRLVRNKDFQWKRIAELLLEADKAHQKMLLALKIRELLTPPVPGRWDKAGGKYTKQ